MNTPKKLNSELMTRPRFQDVLVFTMGTIEKLIDDGLIKGPKLLTESGLAAFEKLKADGFTPTEEETELAMLALNPKP